MVASMQTLIDRAVPLPPPDAATEQDDSTTLPVALAPVLERLASRRTTVGHEREGETN